MTRPGSSAVPTRVIKSITQHKMRHEFPVHFCNDDLVFALQTVVHNVHVLQLLTVLELLVEDVVEWVHRVFVIAIAITITIDTFMQECIPI